jgi:hypothetical protein
MNVEQIISELRQERDCLENAIRALEGTSSKRTRMAGRGKRVMSAEARVKIAAAARRRWAAVRKAKGRSPKAI